MASRFFLSIPDAIPVKEPYEEVFSLFTTETSQAPWAHNRSVSQQSARLEIELDFTPAPSPALSQPGSRPDSRSGSYFSPTTAKDTDTAGNDAILIPGPITGGSGLESDEYNNGYSISTSPSPLSPTLPMTPKESEIGINSSNSSFISPLPGSIPKVKSPAARAILGGRKSSRMNNGGVGGSRSAKVATVSLINKKPVVIHQSLSTLSQPGQTGTVVWDSSILMAKFLLSIKGLTTGCYRSQQKERRVREARIRQDQRTRQGQIRKLEEQAEHLAVSVEGDLKVKPGEEESSADEDQEYSASDDDRSDDYDDDKDDSEVGDGEDDDMLIFDPAETSILELGSGCGLLGIVMADLCQDLLLTDQKPVLPLLVKNLRKNLDKKHFDQHSTSASTTPTGAYSPATASRKKERFSDIIDLGSSGIKPCHIQVQELIWGQSLDQDLKRGLGLDYIVATDVVYNESIIPKLVHTLKELCEIRERVPQEFQQGQGEHFDRLQEMLSFSFTLEGSGRGGHHDPDDEEAMGKRRSRKMRRMLDRTVVLIAQELRTDYVHLAFLESLEQAGFRMVRMPKQMMGADYQSGYVIYACFIKRNHSMAQ